VEQFVVGYDGSDQALDAIEWAAFEAGRHGAGVTIVESWRDPFWGASSFIDAWSDPDAELHRLEHEIDTVEADFAKRHPGVAFSTRLMEQPPVPALLEAAADADLMVVGSRGRGGFSSLLLGSVSQKLARRAHRTLVIVRGRLDDGGDVVVGVDGDPPSAAALAWAAEEARVRGCPLRVVIAWSSMRVEGSAGAAPYVAAPSKRAAEEHAGRIVAEVLGTEHGLEIHVHAWNEYPAKALVDAAQHASLLVIGPWSGKLIERFEVGSTAMQLLHHSPCPLVLVRPPQ
jgi:nucleotide-binding universal stress UspA family protein